MTVEPTLHMWLTYLIIFGAIISYALEKVSIEVTSLGVIIALLLLFELSPLIGPDGRQIIGQRALFAGFADPALIAILALLVVGQGLVQTGALDGGANWLLDHGAKRPKLIIFLALVTVMLISGFLNNTPVVVIFIPILAALSERIGESTSLIMIPLSFAAILGGNLTLIGSSTNLLVAGSYEGVTGLTLNFFDFTVPGLFLAVVGFAYLWLASPRLLVPRRAETEAIRGAAGKQFIVEMEVTADSELNGQRAVAGMFPGLPKLTISMVQKTDREYLPPYDDITLRPGDIVILAATRQALTEVLTKSPTIVESVLSDGEDTGFDLKVDDEHVIAEVVVAPASRMSGRTLKQIAFRTQTGCTVIGVERRSRMVRAAVSEMRIEAGDVLLAMGRLSDVMGLRTNRDVLLLEWSTSEFQISDKQVIALLTFATVVLSTATGLLPIAIAGTAGAAIMIGSNCLNIRQAFRAIDRRIVMLVGGALAMGAALQATGGATYIADLVVTGLEGYSVSVVLSGLFLLIAALTNVLSNNATAVLFTPIAVSVAGKLGVDPMVFVICVIFAANCSFATPMGYQTNLLVMGPGHYRFGDYLKIGGPLVIILWIAFSLFAPWYFDLP